MRKMKKAERKEYILHEAEVLAMSGKYSNLSSIELAIRSDGFEDAQTVLDSPFTIENLNETLKIAQSSTEVENRKLFTKWIFEKVPTMFEIIKKEYPNTNIYYKDENISISVGDNRLDIHKTFGSRKLSGIIHFIDAEGHSYKTSYNVSKKNFEEIDENDFVTLARRVASKSY